VGGPIYTLFFDHLVFSSLPTVCVMRKSLKETCFLCLKAISHHFHGALTIPEGDRKILMAHFGQIHQKLTGHEQLCCDHFVDHDDLLF
jgi:hypothetical protein